MHVNRRWLELGLLLTISLSSATSCSEETPQPGRAERSASRDLLKATPNPIPGCGQKAGETTLTWQTAAARQRVEVRVGDPRGALFAATPGPSSKATKRWVRDGMKFYLIDAVTGDVIDEETVRISAACPEKEDIAAPSQ